MLGAANPGVACRERVYVKDPWNAFRVRLSDSWKRSFVAQPSPDSRSSGDGKTRRADARATHPSTVESPEAGTRLSAAEIHDNILGSAEKSLERSSAALLWSALASGLTIGFSFLFGAYAQTLVDSRYAHAIAGAFYPTGFIFVIFARLELFTENTLEPVIPLLHNRDARTFWSMMRLWGLLIAGNLIGAAIFAVALAHTPIFPSADIAAHLDRIAEQTTSDGFSLTLLRGIMAGWLIALLAWLIGSTKDSVAHLVLIWLTTAPIAWLGFRHSIVGSAEGFYRVWRGEVPLWPMILTFIVPAIIGNAIGGVVLVALLNYGQVHHERSEA